MPVRKPKQTVTEQPLSALERLIRSRIQLLLHFPFFGHLAMYLEFVESKAVGTAGTDGRHYFFNPDFIQSLSDEELNFLTAHEVLHPALGHLWRKGERNHSLFNVAADFVINALIKESDPNGKFFKMPQGGCYSPKFKDMNSEQVYDWLEKNAKRIQVIFGTSPKTLDNHDVWDGALDNRIENDPQTWQERLVQASQQQNHGDLPALIRRMLNEILNPQKNWRVLLEEFIAQEVNDYSFTQPDRRFNQAEFLLPSFSEEDNVIREIVFAIDTSGSISQKQFAIFISEVIGCIRQFGGKIKGTLIYCDAEIPEKGVYDLDDVEKSIPVGGGGTSFVPVFEWIESNLNNECAGLVYLTDGMGEFPKKEPSYPVLWVLVDLKVDFLPPVKVPFGHSTKLIVD